MIYKSCVSTRHTINMVVIFTSSGGSLCCSVNENIFHNKEIKVATVNSAADIKCNFTNMRENNSLLLMAYNIQFNNNSNAMERSINL